MQLGTKQVLQVAVESWLAELLNHMTAATNADHRVKHRISQIKQLYAKHDESHLRTKLKIDWDLGNALDDYRTHSAEVQRYADAITAVAAGHEFLAKLPTV